MSLGGLDSNNRDGSVRYEVISYDVTIIVGPRVNSGWLKVDQIMLLQLCTSSLAVCRFSLVVAYIPM